MSKEKIIEELEYIKRLHSEHWDELGIKRYDQNKFPLYDEIDYGKCGCAEHTINIALDKGLYDDNQWDEFNDLFEEVIDDGFISENLRYYLFGNHTNIIRSSKIINITRPPSFTLKAFIKRVDQVIEWLNKNV